MIAWLDTAPLWQIGLVVIGLTFITLAVMVTVAAPAEMRDDRP